MNQELKNAKKAYKLALGTASHTAETKKLQELIVRILNNNPPYWGSIILNMK